LAERPLLQYSCELADLSAVIAYRKPRRS
jgi:hypothetical protein